MKQKLIYDLDGLTATLDVREQGREVSYSVRLKPDRSTCNVVRTVFDDMETGDPIAQEEYTRSLDELTKSDGALPDHLVWAARGMWGISLEFGPKPEEAQVTIP